MSHKAEQESLEKQSFTRDINIHSAVLKLPFGHNRYTLEEETLAPGTNWTHERTCGAFCTTPSVSMMAPAATHCDWSYVQCALEVVRENVCVIRFFRLPLSTVTSSLTPSYQSRVQRKMRGRKQRGKGDEEESLVFRLNVRVNVLKVCNKNTNRKWDFNAFPSRS